MQKKTLVTVTAVVAAAVGAVLAYLFTRTTSADSSPITVGGGSIYVFNKEHLTVTGPVSIPVTGHKGQRIYIPSCMSGGATPCVATLNPNWTATLLQGATVVDTITESAAGQVVFTPQGSSPMFYQLSANAAYQDAVFDTLTVTNTSPPVSQTLSCTTSTAPKCTFVIHRCSTATCTD